MTDKKDVQQMLEEALEQIFPDHLYAILIIDEKDQGKVNYMSNMMRDSAMNVMRAVVERHAAFEAPAPTTLQ